MIVGDQVTGVVSLQEADREDAYGEPEVNLLTTLAAGMGVALENAQLFTETTCLLAKTARRAADLGTVNAVRQALASELDLDTLSVRRSNLFGCQNGIVVRTDASNTSQGRVGGHIRVPARSLLGTECGEQPSRPTPIRNSGDP